MASYPGTKVFLNKNNIVHLSINPWYFCNFGCKFCYLTPDQLKDRKLLPLEVLDKRLSEIKSFGVDLGHADIYGGEILLLPKGYMQEMKEILHKHGIDEIEIITNLSAYNPDVVEDPDFGISVSYDFEHREKHDVVFANIMKMQRPFTILTLATPEVIRMDLDNAMNWLSTLRNLMAWEIKPYSINQANSARVTHNEYEEFVKKIITSPISKHYEFLNESTLVQAISHQRNSFSDDHVYITPSGNFGVLEFDPNDREYFLELDSFDKYADWTFLEKNRIYDNNFCANCEYMGECLSEHLRPVKSMEEGCNGYFHLIKWAEENL